MRERQSTRLWHEATTTRHAHAAEVARLRALGWTQADFANALTREIEMTNLERFIAEYTKQLHVEYGKDEGYLAMLARNPPDRPHTLPELAVRMTHGLKSGAANKDGNAIKRTCKVLGIKYTYTAIKEFLA
jgi:hypothetical protein